MQTLPVTIIKLLSPFRPTFDRADVGESERIDDGRAFKPGQRTVTAASASWVIKLMSNMPSTITS